VSNLILGVLYHRESLNQSLGNYIIKGNLGYYLYTLATATAFNLMGVLLIEVIFVNANQRRNTKMMADANDAIEVVHP
jgi:hypothetical protein